MMFGHKKLFLPFALLLLVFIFLTAKTSAQTTSPNYDVTLSPVFFDLSSNPGTTVSDKIRVRNNTDSPIPITITLNQLTGDLNGNLSLKPNQSDPTLGWVKFQSKTYVLSPLDWTDIPFSINIPKDAAYGYYFAISFNQDKNSPLTKNGTSITGAAAVPILLNVRKEGARAEAKVLSFTTTNFINEYLPVDFNVKVENVGNIHIKPHGNIFISSGNSKDLAILDVNSDIGSIIPQTARVFNASWADGFITMEPVLNYGTPKLDKNGKPIKHLVINWDKLTSLRIGRYDANLLLVFDNGTRDVPLEANLSFWVFPYKIVGGILIVIIAFILLIRFLLRRYIRRQIKRGSAR